MQLYEAIQADAGLADEVAGFTAEDVENLKSSVTPEGYDWHHHEEPGRIQLVTEEQHAGSGHTGGRTIWGGGIVSDRSRAPSVKGAKFSLNYELI